MNNNYIGVDLDLFRQPKIQRLELKLGKAGVALYLQICLKLAETEGKLYLDDLAILSREFFIQEETIKQVLEFPELFILKDNFYSCDWVTIKIKASKEKSQKARKAILYRWRNNQSNTDVLETNNQSNTIKEKEIKENKNKVNNTPSLDGLNEQVKDLFLSWLENRKKLKKPATDEATRLAIKKLNSFSLDVQKQMLETSILSGWTDFYPPKQTFNSSNSQPTTNNHNQVSKFQSLEETREAFDKRIDILEEERGERFKRVYTEPNKPLPFPKPEFKNI
jgi:hypothetical protein